MQSLPRLALLFLALTAAAFPAASTDQTIEKTAMASFNYRTILEDHVRVRSTAGVVTLTGTVRDLEDQLLAADTVGQLPGVIAVRNQLALRPTVAENTDAWMALKIRDRLLVRAQVSAGTTQVSVAAGIVTLVGTAGTAAQKELTGLCAAEITGVKYVKNNIVVKADFVADPTAAVAMDDASLAVQVKYALLNHRLTRLVKANVTTASGIVRVTGDVRTPAEKALVAQIAQGVRGARSVTNDLMVRG